MKILIVSSATNGRISPFVSEQVKSLEEQGVVCVYCPISATGVKGYLQHFRTLKTMINREQPDLIHAHYGLSGLLSNFQRKVPVITTYHGSDIHYLSNRILSQVSILLSAQNIFVTAQLKKRVISKKGYILPCGVDTNEFFPISMFEAKQRLSLDHNTIYVLFSSRFDNSIKNSRLALNAIEETKKRTGKSIVLLELKGKSRGEVSLLLNASHCLLLTSFSEGSPQIIKEALSTNRPVVSTAVGSVPEMIEGLNGYFLTDFSISSCSASIAAAILFSDQYSGTLGRKQLLAKKLDLTSIAKKLFRIYFKTLC